MPGDDFSSLLQGAAGVFCKVQKGQAMTDPDEDDDKCVRQFETEIVRRISGTAAKVTMPLEITCFGKCLDINTNNRSILTLAVLQDGALQITIWDRFIREAAFIVSDENEHDGAYREAKLVLGKLIECD